MQQASVRAAKTSAERSEPANDDGLLAPQVLPVPARNAPANDNLGDHNLPACLPVTDEEVTFLHRYLSREILGLFS
jgi:hypothetical protein